MCSCLVLPLFFNQATQKNGPTHTLNMQESDHKNSVYVLSFCCRAMHSAAHGTLGFRAGDQQQREPYQPRCWCT